MELHQIVGGSTAPGIFEKTIEKNIVNKKFEAA